MTEIRLCWTPEVEHRTDVPPFSSEWVELTASALAEFEIIIEVANGIYGPSSHWLERREVAGGG